MSTHEEWEKAREMRNLAAVLVAHAVARGYKAPEKQLADFSKYDAEMERIEAEWRDK